MTAVLKSKNEEKMKESKTKAKKNEGKKEDDTYEPNRRPKNDD